MAESTSFAKIKLRTKVETPIVASEIDKQEMMLSNVEKVVFLKDLDGNILRFLPVGDSETDVGHSWSAERILQEFSNYTDFYLDVVDGGSF